MKASRKVLFERRAGPDGLTLPIYMDNHATTPVDGRVLEEMLPYFGERFGNAASGNHAFGWEAEQAVDHARNRIARLIHAKPNEIVFTSGATESDNLAIKGIAQSPGRHAGHIVTCVTEHKAVLDACNYLESCGCEVTYLPVQADGLIDLNELETALTENTVLVSIMAANNEIGVIQPIAEIGRICRARGITFHSDATQAVGRVPMDVEEHGIDLMSISAHKIYGPKGVGALYARNGLRLCAQMHGGGHERGMRSGTLNVPGIVGLGKACELQEDEGPAECVRLAGLRDHLRDTILGALEDVRVNGSMERRLAGNLNLSFACADGDALRMGISDVAVSSGSACSTANHGASHVLHALGISEELASSTLRFGLGRFNTQAEVDYVAARIIETVRGLRELSLP